MSNLKLENYKKYMEMNVQFNYLKGYYNSVDFASIYGVERMEIKHSNFLKWLFEPKKNSGEKAIEYLPIRSLLKLLQNNNQNYDYLNSLNLDDATIEKVKVMREKHDIDLLIILKINNEGYVIVIENKLESLIHDDQLGKYNRSVLKQYESYKQLFVFLHPGFEVNSNQKQDVQDSKYIPITYQEIYDNILKVILEFSNSSETKLIVSYYIHSLACYSSDTIQGLVVTDEEKQCLRSLFEDQKVLKMIDSLYNGKNDEYTEFYYANKKLFIQMFRKYDALYTDDDLNSLSKKIKEIIKNRTYFFNGEHYNGVGELLKEVFSTLLEKYKLEELNDLINLYPESVPLLIEEHEIDNLRTKTQKSWYLNNPKTILINGKTYYVLSAWALNEYEDLKERINGLDIGIILK